MIALLASSHEQMMGYEQSLMSLMQEPGGVIGLLQALAHNLLLPEVVVIWQKAI